MSRRGVVVTGLGGPRGIAAAACRALLRDGWAVLATGWHDGEAPAHGSLQEIVPELSATRWFAWREVDLGRPDAGTALLDMAEEALPSVDALVLAHARSLRGGLTECTAEEFDRHVAVNARGTMLCMAEFARRWRGAHGTGRIVSFVSGPPLPGEIAYAASKGAIEYLTLSAAAELAPRGISVNAVDPGPTDTGWMSPELAEEIRARSPLGRVGTPEDAAELVAFLCSDRGGWITGQVIHSDGGWRALRR